MKLKPIARYPHPQYPTDTLFKSHPEMLGFIPKRWREGVVLLSLLTAFMATGFGQDPFEKDDVMMGAVSLSFPRPLLNEEACKIVEEESARAGIFFDNNSRTSFCIPLFFKHQRPYFKNVFNPYNELNVPVDSGLWTNTSNIISNLPSVLDGVNEEEHIAYEYVSDQDASSLGYASARIAADAISSEFAKDNAIDGYRYAVFSTCDEETLRQQVREFIDWLKPHGLE